MDQTKNQKTNKFGVEIQGIELPEDIKKRIAAEFQEVVLRNIATLDLRKDAGSKSNEIGPKQEDYYYYPVFRRNWVGYLIKYLGQYQNDPVNTLPGKVQEEINLFG